MTFPLKPLLSLKRAHHQSGTKAPHKPVLLLAVVQLFEEGFLHENRIEITPELVATFQKLWAKLVPEPHWQPRMYLPFFHLATEKKPFWFLKANGDMGEVLTKSYSPKSLAALSTVVEYAYFSEEFYKVVLDPLQREGIRKTLMECYFPLAHYEVSGLIQERSDYIQLLEKEFLLGKAAEPEPEEVEEVRCSIFKVQVPKLYDYRCAITGLQVITKTNTSMVDACHIQPWSINHNDTIQTAFVSRPPCTAPSTAALSPSQTNTA